MKKACSNAENERTSAKKHSGAKWLSRLYLLLAAGLLFYVSLLCYPNWPSAFQSAIEHPKNSAAYQAFADFSTRLKEGDGVIAAFSESYKQLQEDNAAN